MISACIYSSNMEAIFQILGKNFWGWLSFLMTECLSCHRANWVIVLKESQNAGTTEFLMLETLLSLQHLLPTRVTNRNYISSCNYGRVCCCNCTSIKELYYQSVVPVVCRSVCLSAIMNDARISFCAVLCCPHAGHIKSFCFFLNLTALGNLKALKVTNPC